MVKGKKKLSEAMLILINSMKPISTDTSRRSGVLLKTLKPAEMMSSAPVIERIADQKWCGAGPKWSNIIICPIILLKTEEQKATAHLKISRVPKILNRY